MIRHAGIVDQDIDLPEPLHGLCEQPLDRILVGHVGRDREGGATLGADRVAQRLQPVEPPRRQHHRDAGAGEGGCDRPADARTGTGDDRDPPLHEGGRHQSIRKMRAAFPPATIAFTSSASGAVRMNCTAGVVG